MNSSTRLRLAKEARTFFSLAPTGGEGRGEGAARAAVRRVVEILARLPSRREPRRVTPPPDRPLTLTLSSDGGEGTEMLRP